MNTFVACRVAIKMAGNALLLAVFSIALGCREHVDYSASTQLTLSVAEDNNKCGLKIVGPVGHKLSAMTIKGKECKGLAVDKPKEVFLPFAVDPTFTRAVSSTNYFIDVEYFDGTKGHFDLSFDGRTSAYTPAHIRVSQSGTFRWKTATFELRNATLRKSQTYRADFRLGIYAAQFYLSKVSIRRANGATADSATNKCVLEIRLGATNVENGLFQTFDFSDGETMAVALNGIECRRMRDVPGTHMYFYVDEAFKKTNYMDAIVRVEYFDHTNGELNLQYDGWLASGARKIGYTPSESLATKGTLHWETGEFSLPQARFANSQNGQADFRILATQPGLHIRRVTVQKIE